MLTRPPSFTRRLGSVAEGSSFFNAKNEELDFHVRLDSKAAVDSFQTLFESVQATTDNYGTYHRKPLEILSIVSMISTGIAFLSSVMDVEMSVVVVLLLMFGTSTLVCFMFVLTKLASIDSLLSSRMVKLLRHQRRLNVEAVAKNSRGTDRAVSAEREEEMGRANAAIQEFWEKVEDTHVPQKLFGVLPLTRLTLAKLGGAIAAALFTTVLRSAIRL